MNLFLGGSLAALLVAAVAAGMMCLLLIRRESNSFNRTLGGLLGATALVNLANGVGLLDEAHGLFWRKIAMLGELAQPTALLYIGVTLLKPSKGQAKQSMLWAARVSGAAGFVLMVLTTTGHVYPTHELSDGQAAIRLGAWSGRIAYIFIVLGMALGLAQLEAVLSASREPIRYQVKFILIGLGTLAAYHIYQASQMLLFSLWQPQYVFIAALVTAMSLALVSLGLMRTRLREVVVNAYISQQAFFGSIAFIVIGLYLLVVGAAGEWLRRTGQPLWRDLSTVLAFGSLIGLFILIFSKKAGSEIRHFIARNFYRSKYDYRARWLEVTQTFQQAATKEAIIDCLFDLLIKIFPTTTISIWSFRGADRLFCQVRPTAAEGSGRSVIELSHPIITQLMNNTDPVSIQKPSDVNDGTQNLCDPLVNSGTALCVPVRSQGTLMAFVAFGKPAHDDAYDTDDCDLLSGIAHHVGALLSHAALSEERQASAELEALHRFSVFCLHDLKNLAARLSLIAQNVGSHGRDPAFQESVMRTVSDTAKKITALVSRLSLKSVEPVPAGEPERLEIASLIEEVVAPMRKEGTVRLHFTGGAAQPIWGVRDQIHQVLLNVILNAKQAIGQNGDISIVIEQLNGTVVVIVDDNGNGIPSRMLESLFQPFQSKRPGGLGIGLYQCKKIVDAIGGTIQVRSEEGKGTQVRIELPLPHDRDSFQDKAMAKAAPL